MYSNHLLKVLNPLPMNSCTIRLNDQLIFEAELLQTQLFTCVVTASDIPKPKEDGLGPIHLMASARHLSKELPQEMDAEAFRKQLAETGVEIKAPLQVGDRIVIEVR